MLAKNKLIGKLFRNKYMKDVDFYVTAINSKGIIGYWVTRGDKCILSKNPDVLHTHTINEADWKEVVNV